jgi:hypothetical protein
MSKEFRNIVQKIDEEEFLIIKKKSEETDSVFLVVLDGKEIKSGNDYILHIQSLFKFPTSCIDNWDGYLDWIRDLSWLNKEEYILVINNFLQFLKDDIAMKQDIISLFEEVILPFWQEEVERVVVDGKPKPFNVYLID